MVKIRLARTGARNQKKYRIVVADEQRAATGAFLEVIGTVDQTVKPAKIVLNSEKYNAWIAKGALPTEVVYALANQNS
jgi:small subunit ribosomal protein S16